MSTVQTHTDGTRSPFQLRPAEPRDAEQIASVRVSTWQAAYRGLLPSAYLDALDPQHEVDRRRAQIRAGSPRTGCLVCETEGLVDGFSSFGPGRDVDLKTLGEIYALYVLPQFWGTGRGRALLGEALRRLHSAGFRQATLWLLKGNQRAARFYQAAGFIPAGARKTVSLPGVELDEARYLLALTAEAFR